jgi:hypothetical protein
MGIKKQINLSRYGVASKAVDCWLARYAAKLKFLPSKSTFMLPALQPVSGIIAKFECGIVETDWTGVGSLGTTEIGAAFCDLCFAFLAKAASFWVNTKQKSKLKNVTDFFNIASANKQIVNEMLTPNQLVFDDAFPETHWSLKKASTQKNRYEPKAVKDGRCSKRNASHDPQRQLSSAHNCPIK